MPTITGRYGRPWQPRLHNIPMPETEEGRKLKELCREIVDRTYPGIRVFEIDYMNIELRLLNLEALDEANPYNWDKKP